MRGLEIGSDWQERLLSQASPPQELAAQAAEKASLRERLQRVKQLYLAGDLSREQYDAEQAEYKQRIIALNDYTASEIQSAARLFQVADAKWTALTRLRQKSLVQKALARATVLDRRLRAVQPTSAAYPIVKMALEEGPSSRCHLRERRDLNPRSPA